MPYNVRGGEDERKEATPHLTVYAKKRKTLKLLKHF